MALFWFKVERYSPSQWVKHGAGIGSQLCQQEHGAAWSHLGDQEAKRRQKASLGHENLKTGVPLGASSSSYTQPLKDLWPRINSSHKRSSNEPTYGHAEDISYSDHERVQWLTALLWFSKRTRDPEQMLIESAARTTLECTVMNAFL